ncbi:MAG TPA: NYN domain-containing protein [Paraburkholderia sp.]|nr:NYN domain-containing protein [Paraburkholderia sp.]
MASPQENVSMAVFCDFENVALGVRDAKIDRFDIRPVLERLLLKGSIVVKKAYCDWDRYKAFKASMHEASFELIEIPHVRQSGKNSADIRLVVDALDLCYTKSHVDTFVIVSGDSDFSPLVSKLRENAKKVIGVGVKNSTSDLLVANCDEFIFYDDLVREIARASAKRESGANEKRDAGATADERQPKPDSEDRKSKAIAFAVETLDALVQERGESGKIWASVLKSAIKRRRPDFNETRYGFRAFGNLLEEAQARGLLEVGRDEKSGAFVSRTTPAAGKPAEAAAASADENHAPHADETRGRRGKGRRDAREGAARGKRAPEPVVEQVAHEAHETHAIAADTGQPDAHGEVFSGHGTPRAPGEPSTVAEQIGEVFEVAEAATPAEQRAADEAPTPPRSAARRARQTTAKKAAKKAVARDAEAPVAGQPAVEIEAAPAADAPAKKKSRKKSAPRAQTKAAADDQS